MIKKYFFIFFVLCFFNKQYGQYQFSGEVNKAYFNATVYLIYADEYTTINQFKLEQILQESKIDQEGRFSFEGDFLEDTNRIYKIFIDNCNENITNYKHLLNQCEDTKSIHFIANNRDSIYFPLNDIFQMFCLIDNTNPINTALIKIDLFQEQLLYDIQNAKSDYQRKAIYKTYFLELRKMSQGFDEPLAELYAFNLYANENSFSRKFYLKDLKKSKYYHSLLKKLQTDYSTTKYFEQYKKELTQDYTPYLQKKTTKLEYISYVLGVLLVLSLGFNFSFLKSRFKKKPIDYKTVLSQQEQKVFVLMNKKFSNKEIAESLFISISTVKSHINMIYSKLSINARKEVNQFF